MVMRKQCWLVAQRESRSIRVAS